MILIILPLTALAFCLWAMAIVGRVTRDYRAAESYYLRTIEMQRAQIEALKQENQNLLRFRQG